MMTPMQEIRRLRRVLKAIADYGGDVGTCRECDEEIDETGLGQAHHETCPYEWARRALKPEKKRKKE